VAGEKALEVEEQSDEITQGVTVNAVDALQAL